MFATLIREVFVWFGIAVAVMGFFLMAVRIQPLELPSPLASRRKPQDVTQRIPGAFPLTPKKVKTVKWVVELESIRFITPRAKRSLEPDILGRKWYKGMRDRLWELSAEREQDLFNKELKQGLAHLKNPALVTNEYAGG